VFDVHGRRGRWIGLLQDYNFKIVHRPGIRHANADALSRNPVGKAMDDEDFQHEIQDAPHTQPEVAETIGKVLAFRDGQHMEWLGNRRQLWGHTECQGHSHGIKHWHDSDPHHLFMIDLVTATDSEEEATLSAEQMEVIEHENLEVDHGELKQWKGQIKYYDRRQQLELVLAAQGLSKVEGHKMNLTTMGEETKYGVEVKEPDIWKDAICLALLKEGVLPDMVEHEEGKRARKRAEHYCWKEQRLFFKDLYVPRPEEKRSLVIQMHEDLGHSGEQKLLTEICRRYFWHCRTEDVKSVVRSCRQCQLVKSEGSVRSGDERLKSILVCDLFYRVAMDTAGPLPETKAGNKYILVAIDHYSKWCEAKAMANHGARTVARFLEDDLICRYGVPGFILTNNGGEWGAKFEVMCMDHAIQH
jgi:hypothetical protein